MCAALAVFEFRDHSHCQYPLSVKRWSHEKVHHEFIECLGQKLKGSELVDHDWMDGTTEKWNKVQQIGSECFEAVKHFGDDSHSNILCALDDLEKRRSLFKSIIVGNGAAKATRDPQGRDVLKHCMKTNKASGTGI